MQTSQVFNQIHWRGAGDPDDCWVVASVQAVNVTSPWLRIVGVKAFRKAAGNPDDLNAADGGNLSQIMRGIEGCYPSLAGHVRKFAGVSWSRLLASLDARHPLSIAIDSSKLPRELAFGFNGRHQICIARTSSKTVLFANPLAPVYSPWLAIDPALIRDAVMSYGAIRSGERSAWYVQLPTDGEALAIYVPSATVDETPFDQADIDKATADLQAKIDAIATIATS